jgi:UrcA family protein
MGFQPHGPARVPLDRRSAFVNLSETSLGPGAFSQFKIIGRFGRGRLKMNRSHILIGVAAAALTLPVAGAALAQGAAYPTYERPGYYPGYEQPGYYPAPGGVAMDESAAPMDSYQPAERYRDPSRGYVPASAPSVDDLVVRPDRSYGRYGRSARGFGDDVVTATRVVSYRDLDLTTTYGVDTLTERVRRAARSACSELDNTYGSDDSGRPCVRGAVADAMSQVHGAIIQASDDEGW